LLWLLSHRFHRSLFLDIPSLSYLILFLSLRPGTAGQHLDVGCISGLAKALCGWGGKDGAVVVVSHDRSFCEKIGFTHVGTVMDGNLVLEQRPLRDSDWETYEIGAANSNNSNSA